MHSFTFNYNFLVRNKLVKNNDKLIIKNIIKRFF